MKKYLLFTLIMIPSIAFTQNKIGLEIGPSYTFFYGDAIYDDFFNPKFGYIGGISFEKDLIKKIAIKTGLFFENKGVQTEEIFYTTINAQNLGTARIKHANYYLTLPLMVKYNMKSFYINGGPYLSYLIDAKYRQIGLSGGVTDTVLDNKPLYKKFDAGLMLGVGKTISLKKFSMYFEIRNSLGLLNIHATLPNAVSLSNGKGYTNSTALIIGFCK